MPPRDDPEETSRALERRFFEETGQLGRIRVAARAIVTIDDSMLIARLAHHESGGHFPGGEIEIGESFDQAIRRELAEETTVEIASLAYRFVANNRFEHDGIRFHFIEHYFEVVPASRDIVSLEDGILLTWIPRSELGNHTILPIGIRDLITQPNWRDVRAIEVS